ncbi:MAG: PilW family protein [Hydrogenophaga sp.]|uniref:PilW family protein n=1 Tax=Hydrogenophaga sp. TaxID=1904254 RepID=UPI002630A6CB|nr:PilW family protein [Hydrogenophaga sp.]MCV0438667.1 PilW family protein [Hydrogenophaga sp.]
MIRTQHISLKSGAAHRAGRLHLRSRGASLIELMVAMTIGLIVALIVVATVTGVGASFRTIGSNASAQVSAQVGLGLIDEAGRSAGAGFYSNGQIICPSINAWASGVTRLNDATLMPVRITDGGAATASDTITFTTSAGVGPLSNMPVMVNMATAGEDITVNDSGLIAANDLAVVGAPGGGGPCTLFQVTSAPVPSVVCGGNATSCKVLPRATDPATGYNPPDPAAAFAVPSAYGFSTAGGALGPATVVRIGAAFRQPAFTVQCEALVAYNAFTDAPTCTTNPLSFAGGGNALASDIVLMHAQYGISPDAVTDEVTAWVDAAGVDWAAPTADNVQRIKAIRVILISRAKEAATTDVTTAACTNDAGVVNVGPCSFQDAAAPVIDLSATPVAAGRTWQNYRYRVHRAIIPLRNVLWSN